MDPYGSFYRALSQPLIGRSRPLLAVLVVPLLLAFSAPLWSMKLVAPQYPQGLRLDIWAYTVEGDIQEVNTLNHYIGMARIDRTSLSDLDWIPFALGALALLTLRAAAVGDLRSLIDLVVLFGYFSVFSLGRFYYRLYVFGHNLDPRAPFDMPAFTPPLVGTQQIANFTTTSMPAGASYWIALFAVGLLAVAAWNLLVRAREAQREL